MSNDVDACEAREGDGWVRLTIEDALDRSPRPDMRCPKCGGRVRAHKQAINGMRAHFEHRTAHVGCSLGSCYGGNRSRHPDALI